MSSASKLKWLVQPTMQCFHTWMIKVELALLCLGLLLWSQHLVEAVLTEDHHLSLVMVNLVLPQQLHDLLTHRRLQKQTKRQCQPPSTQTEGVKALEWQLVLIQLTGKPQSHFTQKLGWVNCTVAQHICTHWPQLSESHIQCWLSHPQLPKHLPLLYSCNCATMNLDTPLGGMRLSQHAQM